MSLSSLHTGYDRGTYQQERDHLLKLAENAPLYLFERERGGSARDRLDAPSRIGTAIGCPHRRSRNFEKRHKTHALHSWSERGRNGQFRVLPVVRTLFFGCMYSAQGWSGGLPSLPSEPPGSSEYTVQWAVEPRVCEFARTILNSDLEKYGFDAKEHHNPFKTIQWQLVVPAKGAAVDEFAVFDIDNDGDKDWVISVDTHVNDIAAVTRVFVFDAPFSRSNRTAMFRESHGSIVLDGHTYPLRGFQQNRKGPADADLVVLSDRGFGISAAFTVRPFIYEGTSFIAMRDHQLSSRRRWMVIAKYKGGHVREDDWEPGQRLFGFDPHSLDDVCYLERLNTPGR